MTDDLDKRIRDRVRRASLPEAPAGVREYLAALPIDDPRSASPNRRVRGAAWFAAAAVVIVALGLASVAFLGSAPVATPAGTAGTIASTGSPPVPRRSPPAPGFRTFEAPGITFDYPEVWTDQTNAWTFPAVPGVRLVALLAQGMSICPQAFYQPVQPSPQPSGCQREASEPGTLMVMISEYEGQYPDVLGTPAGITSSGYPIRETIAGGASTLGWLVRAPDDGLYYFSVSGPPSELVRARPEMESLFSSLALSAWEPQPPITGGRAHIDSQQGFSFDYPAGWVVYYPQDSSMHDSAVVTVASKRVLPACPSSDAPAESNAPATSECGRFKTPPGATVIEFRVGGGGVLNARDWTKASTTIGGQPAFGQDWGAENATGADEGHSWSVRLSGSSELGIYASLTGPDIPTQRAAMDMVLASIRITPIESPAP